MAIKSDKWIRRMAQQQRMIEPFEPDLVREIAGQKIVSYGTSSYGYDIRCADEFKVFTNVHSAVVDPKTDVFYWAATDANGECTLYTVDLDDASVTRVCASPYQQLALNVLPPLAEDKAPAAIQDFAVHFDAPATSGTATFTLPTKTFDGDDNLTGQLT